MEDLETPVHTVMTRPVRTVPADCPVREAAGIMIDADIGSVVVDDTPAGIVTKTDIVATLRSRTPVDETTVADLMTTPVETVAAEATLQEAVDAMDEHGIRRLPVTADGELVGIVTTTDLVEELAIDLDTLVGMFADA